MMDDDGDGDCNGDANDGDANGFKICQNRENHYYRPLFWFITGISCKFCNMRKTIISGIL